MTISAFDTETFLIGASNTTPPLVCLTYATCDDSATSDRVQELCNIVRQYDGPTGTLITGVQFAIKFGLLGPDAGLSWLQGQLQSESTQVVGHNAPFDLLLACEELPGLRETMIVAVEAGRVTDTLIRDQLIDIACGEFRSRIVVDDETGEETFQNIGYHLTDLTDRRLGFKLDKGEDSWRLRYADLATVPINQWPLDAVKYAVLDALSTLAVYLHQREQWAVIPDEQRQVKAAIALAAIAARGLCVDPPAVERLSSTLLTDVMAEREYLTTQGIYKPDGVKDTKVVRARIETAFKALGKRVPLTDGGKSGNKQTAMDRLTLLDSKDPVLKRLADIGQKQTILTGFVQALREGYQSPVVCRYHTLVETGRTSCVGPNVQNQPRYPGVRDCFVPRHGYYLCSVDFDTLELRTLAQVCKSLLGWSDMCRLLQSDPEYDLHSDLAAMIRGCSYPEFMEALHSKDSAIRKAAKEDRQRAKASNFGYPGGLGPEKFKTYARATYGLELTLDECVALREKWRARWPEVVEYQRLISSQLNDNTNPPTADFVIVNTGFMRGNCRYTQACNTQFQGLAAAGAKAALWRVFVEGINHNVFPVAFLHDEVLAEVPIECAHEAAYSLSAMMIAAMQELTPDVPITAKPALMRRWYKGAEPTFVDGRLVPWEP